MAVDLLAAAYWFLYARVSLAIARGFLYRFDAAEFYGFFFAAGYVIFCLAVLVPLAILSAQKTAAFFREHWR